MYKHVVLCGLWTIRDRKSVCVCVKRTLTAPLILVIAPIGRKDKLHPCLWYIFFDVLLTDINAIKCILSVYMCHLPALVRNNIHGLMTYDCFLCCIESSAAFVCHYAVQCNWSYSHFHTVGRMSLTLSNWEHTTIWTSVNKTQCSAYADCDIRLTNQSLEWNRYLPYSLIYIYRWRKLLLSALMYVLYIFKWIAASKTKVLGHTSQSWHCMFVRYF